MGRAGHQLRAQESRLWHWIHHDTRDIPVPWLLNTGWGRMVFSWGTAVDRRDHCSGRAVGAGHRQDMGGGQGAGDSHDLLLLLVQYRESSEPGPRAPKPPSGMLYLILCLVSALSVSLPFPSAPHAQTCGWSALSALLPSPCSLVSIKHTPSSLHLLQMPFARDVQFSLQSP